jgi:hypothetical protein
VWEGYWLPKRSKLIAESEATPGDTAPGRFLGAAPGHNKVVGGLLLHTTRKGLKGNCQGNEDAALIMLAPASPGLLGIMCLVSHDSRGSVTD